MNSLVAVAAPTGISLAIAVAYALLLGPGRAAYYGDQGHYEELARILATTGQFARALADTGPVAEPLRTIGYPAFLALVRGVAGPGYVPVVAVQVLLVATLPALIFLVARPYLTMRRSLGAAWVGAVYLPFAYYSVFTLSDLLATVLVAGASALFTRALTGHGGGNHVLAGVLLGGAGLVRPALLVLGCVLILPLLARPHDRARRAVITLLAVLAYLAIGVVPSYAYTYSNFGRLSVNAAGGGIGLWYGYWQGVWSGKTTEAILAAGDRAPSEEAFAREAALLGVDVALAATYASEFRRLREILEPAGTSIETVRAYIETDKKYGELARERTAADTAGWLGRGVLYRSAVFWFGEIPVAPPAVGAIPTLVLIAIWGAQLLLVILALIGVVVLAIRRPTTGLWFAVGLVALWLAHFPFSAEARYSLPVKTWLIVLAVVGAGYPARWLSRVQARSGRGDDHVPARSV